MKCYLNIYQKLIAFASLLSVALVPSLVSAMTNQNGVVVTDEEVKEFSKVYSPEYIYTMTQDDYDRISQYDFDNIRQVEKYVMSTYNSATDTTTEVLISEEDYNNFVPMVSMNGEAENELNGVYDDTTLTETQVKKLTLSYMTVGGNYDSVSLTLVWKYIPQYRSFDVIGVRGEGFTFRNGSQTGRQIYKIKSTGEFDYVRYAWNGTNIKKFNDGFGISMNIVNTDILQLSISLDCDVVPTKEYPMLFGSYQHVQHNITLAQSQNYTLGGAGLGGVFVYPYSISQYFDGMAGASIVFR